jgi:hypothetical protein
VQKPKYVNISRFKEGAWSSLEEISIIILVFSYVRLKNLKIKIYKNFSATVYKRKIALSP